MLAFKYLIVMEEKKEQNFIIILMNELKIEEIKVENAKDKMERRNCYQWEKVIMTVINQLLREKEKLERKWEKKQIFQMRKKSVTVNKMMVKRTAKDGIWMMEMEIMSMKLDKEEEFVDEVRKESMN
ncbi:MAG: hypothetical protein EZS28_004173 [Streblomastix strix]|uniref:Uncharacterized protein n=1 Tax=Streblomastix strix TaxID=222440 RepID=A0A5J4X0H6_9EUKA|nr:MAG: hypothetical protein EZS28_004173 [Streblomastix strix]